MHCYCTGNLVQRLVAFLFTQTVSDTFFYTSRDFRGDGGLANFFLRLAAA